MGRGGTSQVRCNSRNRTHAQIETAAVATESGEPDWLLDIMKDMDSNLQYKQNEFNSIAAKTDKVVEGINKAYGKDSTKKLSEKELCKTVLNVSVPTAITDAGSSASCGKPSVSDCGKFTLENDPFIATGRK